MEKERGGKGRGFVPDYEATLTVDVSGDVLLEVGGYFMRMSSNVAHIDVWLTFSDTFEDFEGTHLGYLHMERTSKGDPDIEIFYTYKTGDVWYYLHGFGTFEENKKEGWFTIESSGTFTISESINREWIQVWEGTPSFTVVGEKL